MAEHAFTSRLEAETDRQTDRQTDEQTHDRSALFSRARRQPNLLLSRRTRAHK